ncbi:MFS transporter [Aestuariispira insulae]|uniref:MFS transporter n=1 Tax=Aestuariispira insulae TaxID=1461337 RepID=A0A3D9HMN2_9PROT|nr:MFS transporter [Aestuariispira insulae]RED50760.1 MFS transporter [Aestuariispira insulae]
MIETSIIVKQGRGAVSLFFARIGVSAVCGPLAFAFNAMMVEVYHYAATDLSLVRIFASIIALSMPLLLGLWVDRGMGKERLSFLLFSGCFFWGVFSIELGLFGWILAVGMLGAYASLGDMALARAIPNLFEKHDYQRVNAYLLMAGSLVAASGAAIAGSVISFAGFEKFAVAGVVLTALAGVFFAFWGYVPIAQTTSSATRTGFWQGAKLALGNRDIRLLLLHGAMAIITFTIVDMLLYLFLSRIVGLSLSAIAIVISIRILIGAFSPALAARRYGWLRLGSLLFLLSFASGAAWMLFGAMGANLSLVSAALIVAVPAALSALFNVHAASFRQLIIPPELQAQTIAVTRALMFAAMPLAGGLVFLFGDLAPLTWLFIAAGCFQMAAAPMLLFLRNR